MGEIYDLNAFKKKKEEVRKELIGKSDEDEKFLEHFRATREKVNLPPSILDIDQDRLDEISAIINSGPQNQRKVEEAKAGLVEWTAGEIVEFLKKVNILDLRAKPAFTTALIEVLRNKELGKR